MSPVYFNISTYTILSFLPSSMILFLLYGRRLKYVFPPFLFIIGQYWKIERRKYFFTYIHNIETLSLSHCNYRIIEK